jgi:hypothetical protein
MSSVGEVSSLPSLSRRTLALSVRILGCGSELVQSWPIFGPSLIPERYRPSKSVGIGQSWMQCEEVGAPQVRAVWCAGRCARRWLWLSRSAGTAPLDWTYGDTS